MARKAQSEPLIPDAEPIEAAADLVLPPGFPVKDLLERADDGRQIELAAMLCEYPRLLARDTFEAGLALAETDPATTNEVARFALDYLQRNAVWECSLLDKLETSTYGSDKKFLLERLYPDRYLKLPAAVQAAEREAGKSAGTGSTGGGEYGGAISWDTQYGGASDDDGRTDADG